MPLRPEEFDPTIQTLLKERMAQIFNQHNPPMDPISARVRSAGMEAWRNAASRNTAFFLGGGISVFATIFGPAFAANSGQANPLLVMFVFMGLAAGMLVTGFRRTQDALTKHANADVMRYAGEYLALSRGEKAYCEAAAALIDAGSVLSEDVQRDVIQQLNGLLGSYRRLEDPLRRAQAASATESIDALEQELAGLMSRRDAQSDADARAMMDQSVELCRRRLEGSRAVEPARQKAEAQQELIVQTMASVQASLGRTRGVNIKTPDLNLGELQKSVAQVDTQTRAVEEAVAEVVAIGA
jgi:hypothetical protein